MPNQTTIKTNYKYFIIAEILAIVSFILNTINVALAEETYGPGPIWAVKFGFIYLLKTILAIIGIIYFWNSGALLRKRFTGIVSFSTIITLWYSIPIINLVCQVIVTVPIKLISHSTMHFEYNDRIIIQIIWCLPVLAVLFNLVKQSMLYLIKPNYDS